MTTVERYPTEVSKPGNGRLLEQRDLVPRAKYTGIFTPIGMEVIGVFDVDSNGRIAGWHDYYDLPTLVEQVAAATASPS